VGSPHVRVGHRQASNIETTRPFRSGFFVVEKKSGKEKPRRIAAKKTALKNDSVPYLRIKGQLLSF
jgi:hypothetical protein